MTAALVSAIDVAVAFVHDRSGPMTETEVKRLKELAGDVYRLARADNLIDSLPKVSELRPGLELPSMPPLEFLSKLNLPGDWRYADDSTSVFDFSDSDRWYDDMAMLRSLASGVGKQTASPKGTPGRKSDPAGDQKLYSEYCTGRDDGKWTTQADYLRKRHAAKWKKNQNAAKAWFSQLIKRVEEAMDRVK